VSAAGEEEDAGAADEKAAKAVARGAPAAPDRTIHLVPVLTLLCFLVLFLLSHDPSAAALTGTSPSARRRAPRSCLPLTTDPRWMFARADSPVLAAAATVAARSLDAAAAGAGGCPRISSAADGAATRGFRGVCLSASHAYFPSLCLASRRCSRRDDGVQWRVPAAEAVPRAEAGGGAAGTVTPAQETRS